MLWFLLLWMSKSIKGLLLAKLCKMWANRSIILTSRFDFSFDDIVFHWTTCDFSSELLNLALWGLNQMTQCQSIHRDWSLFILVQREWNGKPGRFIHRIRKVILVIILIISKSLTEVNIIFGQCIELTLSRRCRFLHFIRPSCLLVSTTSPTSITPPTQELNFKRVGESQIPRIRSYVSDLWNDSKRTKLTRMVCSITIRHYFSLV